MGTNIVRVPKSGSLDVTLSQDPSAGTRVSSQFHECDYRHSLAGGGLLYLDPPAQQALLDSGARQGDTVRLTRMRRGDESYLAVQLISDAAEPEPQRPVRPAAPVSMTATARPLPTPIPAQPPRPEMVTINGLSQQVAGCLRAVLDGFKEAQAYADQIQSGIRFTETNVTSFAISLFIDARRSGK